MRGFLVLSVLSVFAVAVTLPISAVAKNNSSNSAKTTPNGAQKNVKPLTVKKTNGGVAGPVKSKGGTVSTVKGESIDIGHKDKIEAGGTISLPPPPPPPPPK
jgi:hypothetical protein